MPLKGLELVDWSHLSHSHGSAERFPQWLHELESGDATAWSIDIEGEDTALNKLWNLSIHQGSIYQVTPYVVPFINQLLEFVSPSHKILLIKWLTQLATGHPYPTINNVLMRHASEKRGLNFDELVSNARLSFSYTQEKLRDGIPIYIMLFVSSDSYIRQVVIELMGAMMRQSNESKLILLSYLDSGNQDIINGIISASNLEPAWPEHSDDNSPQ